MGYCSYRGKLICHGRIVSRNIKVISNGKRRKTISYLFTV